MAAAFVAGPEAGERVRAAFDWRGPAAAAPSFRSTAGSIRRSTPMPPLIVTLAEAEQRLRAPVNATLVVRIAGQGDATVTPGAGLKAAAALRRRRGPTCRRSASTLSGGTADVTVQTGLVSRHRLVVEDDPRPSAGDRLSRDRRKANGRGTFTIAYTAKDDYGIASADGLVEPLARNPPAGAARRASPCRCPRTRRRPRDPAPSSTPHRKPVGRRPCQPDPGGQGRGRPGGPHPDPDVTLPGGSSPSRWRARSPRSAARLVLDPDGGRSRVQASLDALLIAPERFTPEWWVFLGLKDAARRLRGARDDAALDEVADWLWAMALQIEEGDLSDCREGLRARPDRLKEAVVRGAPDEEIKNSPTTCGRR